MIPDKPVCFCHEDKKLTWNRHGIFFFSSERWEPRQRYDQMNWRFTGWTRKEYTAVCTPIVAPVFFVSCVWHYHRACHGVIILRRGMYRSVTTLGDSAGISRTIFFQNTGERGDTPHREGQHLAAVEDGGVYVALREF